MADFKYSAGIDVNLNVKGMNNQLKDLQKQLQQISNMKIDIGSGNLTADIEKASEAAMKLSAHLATATNPQTGNLDFTKFYTSIQKSGASLEDYGKALQNMGPAGQKAFVSLADSISKAEIPLKRTSKLVDGMWDNLKKTIGWQMSSSLVHSFIGSMQQAVGYAKDLNKSLTDIRIVTGASTDQMAQFAKEANKAAKNLSTTTTDYTKASLIYYQQGLSDQEVKARTETTIKMANATGTSAQKVSDQMTAIWNNFDNGTKSLTHYADVMTALGAATASSTDEIAQGLQKFAAISDTVGLSYEYAATALATITSTSRESADVVGNSLKTLFTRIQGLQLGETLDDGTTLNKYSTALAKVGISIKDSSGELKDMDLILDEMGNKWETLARDEQMALAQTVAGVRQYTQLMTLMENWDTFKQNLNVANTSSGTLDAQAAIYAESWEAASARVRTSWEGLWDNLINSDGFIMALDGISGLVGILDNMVTGLGGAGGALATFGGVLTKVFNKQIASTVSDIAYSIKMLKPGELDAMKQKQLDFINSAKESMSQDYSNPLYGPNESKIRRESMSSSLDASRAFLENRDHMSEEQLLLEQMFADQAKSVSEQKIQAARKLDQAHVATADSYFKLFSDMENMSNHYLTDANFYTSKDGVKILSPEAIEQEIQQKTEERVKALQHEQESLLDGSITPEKDQRFTEIEREIPQVRQQVEGQVRQQAEQARQRVSSLPTYKDELTTRANNLAKIYKDFNDIFKNNDSGKAKDTADSLSAFIDGLKNADSETLKTLANSEFFTNLSEGLKQLKYTTDDNGNQVLTAESSQYLSEQMAQLQGFNTTAMSGLADQITERIKASGKFTGDANELQAQVRELAQNYLAEQYAKNGFDSINMKPFDPTNEKDPRVQNMKKQETQNKAEAAVAGAQGIMQTLAAVESFKALGHEIENLGNGTTSLMSVLSSMASLSLNAASGFQGLHMAMSQFFTTLSPKAVTGWSLGIMGALAAVSLAFEAFDYFTTSAQEYATSIARSTQNLQNAATTTAEAFEQSQQDSETHLANVRKIESYSQDPSEMANAIYEANKQAIDMITKYGQNWVEGNEYTVDQNTGLIKIKESTLENVQEEKESISEDFERTANLAQATQQMESAINNFTDGVQLSKEHFLDYVIPLYEEYLSGSEDGRKNWESFLSGYKGELHYDQIIEESAKNYINGLRSVELISQQNAGKILQEQGYSSQDTQGYEFLQKQASDIYQKEYLDKLNSYDDLVGGKNGWIDQMNPEAIKMAERYLEAQGRLGVEGLKYRNGELKYYSDDTSGEQSIEWEDVKRWQAEQEAEKAVTGVGEDGKSWLDKQIETNQGLYMEQGKGADAVLSFGEFGNLNQVSIEALKAADNITGASQKITTALKGKTFQEFSEAVDKALAPVDTFESLFKNLGETTIDYGSLSAESLQNLDKNIHDFIGEEAFGEAQKWLSGNWENEGTDTNNDGKNTFEDMSSEAQNLVKYTEGIEQMLQSSGLDAEGMAQAFNQIAQLDWTNDAGTNLRNIVATIGNLGGDINIADWDHLRGIMQDLSGIMPDYSGTIAQLIQIQQLLNSLKNGDAVTAEINVLLNMMGIKTVSDGKGGFIVTSSQEEIDDAARSNQGEINDKVTSARNTQAVYNDYKNKAESQGGQVRTTGFESYEDLVDATNPNSENYDQGLTDFLNTAGGGSLDQALTEAETATKSAVDNRPRWQRLLGIGADEQQEAEETSSNMQQAAVDLVNDMIETGQEGASTEDIQSLAATYEDAAGLMEAINSENSAFRNEDGLVDSGTLEYLKTLPETSERATEAINQFAEAENNLYDIRRKAEEDGLITKEEQDAINRAQEIADEAAAYAELQTAIDAVAEARGLDAEQLAYMVEKLREKGELPTDEDISSEGLANYAANYLERQQAIEKLTDSYLKLDKAINGAEGSAKNSALGDMQNIFKQLTGNIAFASMSMAEFEKVYKRFKKDFPDGMSRIMKGDIKGYRDLAKTLIKTTIAQEKNVDVNNETAQLYDNSIEGLEKYADSITTISPELEEALAKFSPGQTISEQVANSQGALDNAGRMVTDAFHNLKNRIMAASPGISEAAAAAAAAAHYGMEAIPIPKKLPSTETEVTTTDIVCDTGEHGDEHLFSEENTVDRTTTQQGGTVIQWELVPLGEQPTIPSGGGGGGGGAKEPKKVANKRKSQTVKRYKRNDAKRSSAQKSKKSEENKKDYLYGEQKIAQMEKINKLAEKEAKITANRISESRKYLIEDRQNLIKYMQKYGFEAEFDADGFLSNYEEAWTKIYEEIAALYEDNKLTEKEEKIEEKLNIKLEELEGALEDYENSLSELADDIEAYEESLYEMYDNKVEALQHKVEFKIELEEDDLEYLDFWIETLGDNIYNSIEAIEAMGEKANILFNGLDVYKQGVQDIYDLSNDPLQIWATGGLEEVLTQDQVDALRENRDGLMDYMQQLIDLREEIKNKVLDTFDSWQEKIDATSASLQHYTSVIEHFKNIIDTIGKDPFGLSDEFMKRLEQNAINQSMDNIDANKAYYESLVDQQEKAQQELNDARARGDESSIQHWEEVVRTTTEAVESAQDALLTSLEDTLTMIAEQFETSMQRAVDAFNDAIYAYGGLEGLQNDYSLAREYSDLMAEDYQKIYELSKLNRSINKTLSDSNIIAGKQKMKSLQQEINELQASGVELSQYDLEYLQAKYELRLAEIELENAQNNKDTVRLSKDSEGNWSYIYTSSTDKVEEAQQKYEDALYNMQQLSYEYMEEMSSAMMETSLAMMEEIQNLRIQDFDSYEAYSEAVQRIQDKYAAYLRNQENELNKSVENNKDLYNQDWQNYSAITGYKISENQLWADNFSESTLGALTGSDSAISDFSNNILGLSDTMINGLGASAMEYFGNVEAAMNKYGASIASFGTTVTSTVSNISSKSKTAADDMKDMASDMKNAFIEIADYVSDWQEEFSEQIDTMLEEIKTLVQSINEAIRKSAEMTNGKSNAGNLIGSAEAVDLLNAKPEGYNYGEYSYDGKVLKVNGEATTWIDQNAALIEAIDKKMAEYTSARTGSKEREELGEELKELFKKYHAFKDIVSRIYDNGSTIDLEAPEYSSFDTGGYTGEWGNSGKLAMLHQKELILNPDDTSNFLDALNISRDLIHSMIEMNARASSFALGDLIPSSIQDMSQQLEQQVSIVAEFPNATDHNEIAEALDNLINTASQYANRFRD